MKYLGRSSMIICNALKNLGGFQFLIKMMEDPLFISRLYGDPESSIESRNSDGK